MSTTPANAADSPDIQHTLWRIDAQRSSVEFIVSDQPPPCLGCPFRRGHRGMAGTRLFVFARHAESTANVARVVSSNPAHPVWLTARGKVQARQLAVQLAGIDVDLAVATRLPRIEQTCSWHSRV